MSDPKDQNVRDTNPKEGAASGADKSSSTSGDEGPKTTRSTTDGESIVDVPVDRDKFPSKDNRKK